jgi:hypothetical protein
LEAGSSAEIDADVIFTAAFVGLALGYARKGKNWRVAMEPETDPAVGAGIEDRRQARTDKDKGAMKRHNHLCTLVNHVARKSLGSNNFKLTWGFTPLFTAGGMIAGGDNAGSMDQTLLPLFKETARKYLTAAKSPSSRTDPWEMYIGRGAYCGLVLDDEGNAVTAMSTLRTTLKEGSTCYPHPLDIQVGDRWCPPATDKAFQDKEANWLWGMIGDLKTQSDSQSEGMKFYCGDNDQKGTAVVGYTHGLPRCVYECIRAKKGHPYEMSIGTKTFKLASCMGCTFFMVANGFDPSASHVGRAESWSPLYHVYGNNPSEVLAPLDAAHDQIAAVQQGNDLWADAMTAWMKDGIDALDKVVADKWVKDDHIASLKALGKRLSEADATKDPGRRTCSNLVLDAFSFHKGDADRVISTLTIGQNPMANCDGATWWWDSDNSTTLDNYTNRYTDNELSDMADLSALKL